MAKFLTELHICPHPDDDGRWYLAEPLGYRSDILGDDIWVEKHFLTDLASVPRVPIAYWLYGNRAHRSAVVHDWLYQRGTLDITRAMADDIFLEAMTCTGHRWVVRYVMYSAVVAVGWTCYKKHDVEYYTPPSGSCDGSISVNPSGA